MEKIYYNENGWVCERYPYDIPVEDDSRFIEVEDEVANKTYSCKIGYSWRVTDGELEQAIYDNDAATKQKHIEELAELETWFSDIYDMQMKQYERCMRLGIAFTSKYGTAEELDSQAVEKAARINELRALIKGANA